MQLEEIQDHLQYFQQSHQQVGEVEEHNHLMHQVTQEDQVGEEVQVVVHLEEQEIHHQLVHHKETQEEMLYFQELIMEAEEVEQELQDKMVNHHQHQHQLLE